MHLAPVAGAIASALALAPAQTPLTTTIVASGLERPVWLGAPPADRARLFAIEQHRARVRVIRNGQLLAPPFLDLGGQVATGGEQGLLGLAFHPRYADNGRFFVSHTRRADGAFVLASYRASTNPDVADPASVRELLAIPQPQAWHNGGCIAFGPDGYLYVAMGDGGGAGSSCPSQNGGTLLGKMLRLDVDQGTPYGIPPTNPFVADPQVRPEIWQSGLRNPWRFSFDRVLGHLYVADVGGDRKEEVSFVPGSSRGGENLGWPIMEGPACYQTSCGGPPCGDPRLTLPIHSYDNGTAGNCCIIGGHVYRGCAVPDLQGDYFFADLCSARIWSFRWNGQQTTGFRERTAELNPPGPQRADNITSFGEDACGELYLTGFSGRVHKIVAAAPAPATNLGFGTPGTGGRVPTLEACGLLGTGLRADFTLRGAPPGAPALLLVSRQSQPLTLANGTVVPYPILLAAVLTADAVGEVTFRVPGVSGGGTAYCQFAILDPGASGGIALSNALRVDFP